MTGQTWAMSLWFGAIFLPPFSQSDFDFRYLLGSYNLLRSLNMYVGPSVGLCVCQLAFQSVILITSKDSRPWLWPHCYTIRTWASGLKSGVLVRGSRAAPAALNGLKFFRTQGGFSLFWTNGFWAAAPKGTKSSRTQGDFPSFVHLSVCLFVHPP